MVELLTSNWEYVLIIILAIDKIVALSPTEWDDLIWTSIKKSIFNVNFYNFQIFCSKNIQIYAKYI